MQNSKKRNNVGRQLALSLFIIIFLGFAAYFWLATPVKSYLAAENIKSNYKIVVKSLLPQAVETLKINQNGWSLCTIDGLLLNNIDDPKTQAAFIAYFRYGADYCKTWWIWPENPCDQLAQQISQAPNRILLKKQLTLCQLAEKIK